MAVCNELFDGQPNPDWKPQRSKIATVTGAAAGEMPRYRCHKEVRALKIASITRLPIQGRNNASEESDGCHAGAEIVPADQRFSPFTVNVDYLRRHKPQAGGYFVVYVDGYQSFSPAAAFEEGYARI